MDTGLWRLTVSLDFSASHAIREYPGKCERLHGHNFVAEVEVEGRRLDPATGMLLDFKLLKTELKAVLEELDHCHLNEAPAFVDQSPSSENIARHIHQGLSARLAPYPVRLVRVSVSEKPGQSATYLEPAEG